MLLMELQLHKNKVISVACERNYGTRSLTTQSNYVLKMCNDKWNQKRWSLRSCLHNVPFMQLMHWWRLEWISFPDTLHYTELHFAPEVREASCLSCNKNTKLTLCSPIAEPGVALTVQEQKDLRNMIDYDNNCQDKCNIDNEVLYVVLQCDAWGYMRVGALSSLTSAFID